MSRPAPLRALGDRPAHDPFVRDRLPAVSALPTFVFDPPFDRYPERLNAAVELVDGALAEGAGEHVAVVNDHGSWTYRDMADLSARIAGMIRAESIVPGARVLLRGPNSAMLIAAWLGVLKAGCIAVTTMPLLRRRDLEPIVHRAEPALALIDGRSLPELGGVAWLEGAGCRTLLFDGDSDACAMRARLERQAPIAATADTHRDDPAILAFTSGTTGAPKATVHFHRDLLIPADGFSSEVLNPGPADRFCSSAPLGFTFGLGASLLFPFRARASSVTVEQSNPAALIEAVERHRATVLLTAPTAYRAMLPLLVGRDLSSLRLCVSAGEHLPASTQSAWSKATGVAVVNGIGATEMMHIFLASRPGETPPGSCGQAVSGYDVRIVDEAGMHLASGTGRLAVRGPTGCRYLDDPRQSRYVVKGWNLTGDTYHLDEEGRFWFVARSDDMIVTSGYNVAGPEVEAALVTHHAVAECAVVGVDDHSRGTVIKAFVVLETGYPPSVALIAELQAHVKRTIAPYKYPRLIEFVPDLPKTPTGKVRKAELRA